MMLKQLARQAILADSEYVAMNYADCHSSQSQGQLRSSSSTKKHHSSGEIRKTCKSSAARRPNQNQKKLS